MTREVVFAPDAEEDLISLYDYIASRAYPDRAFAYTESIRTYCLGFGAFPERGTRRDGLRPGLRTIGFERRVTVAFHVTAEHVVIDRILYAGRDIERLLAGSEVVRKAAAAAPSAPKPPAARIRPDPLPFLRPEAEQLLLYALRAARSFSVASTWRAVSRSSRASLSASARCCGSSGGWRSRLSKKSWQAFTPANGPGGSINSIFRIGQLLQDPGLLGPGAHGGRDPARRLVDHIGRGERRDVARAHLALACARCR